MSYRRKKLRMNTDHRHARRRKGMIRRARTRAIREAHKRGERSSHMAARVWVLCTWDLRMCDAIGTVKGEDQVLRVFRRQFDGDDIPF